VVRYVDFFGLGLLTFSLALTLATISSTCSLVRQVAFKCDIQLLLFEPEARFASYGGKFLQI